MIKITRLFNNVASTEEYRVIEIVHRNDKYSILALSVSNCIEILKEGQLVDVLKSMDIIRAVESAEEIYNLVIREDS